MMFLRLLMQMLRSSYSRLAIALVALVSGAAVASALVNLHLDASRKLTQEFRVLGANVIVEPQRASGLEAGSAMLLEEASLQPALGQTSGPLIAAAPYLFLVAQAPPVGAGAAKGSQTLVVVGTWLDQLPQLEPWLQHRGESAFSRSDIEHCLIGREAARALGVQAGSRVELASAGRSASVTVAALVETGSSEDNQIFVNLPAAQRLGGLDGKVSLAELSVAGSPEQVGQFVEKLARTMPGANVRQVRQLAEAEGRLLGRIRALILSMVVLILSLSGLCVLATMTALAVERKRDVGLMKAIGGSMHQVLRFFLLEMAVLGAAGGALGYGLGMILSVWIGRSVFGTAISPRLEVLPLTIVVSIIVAVAGAFPLRLLGRIRPAVILRGD